ncbi:LOG family protein [Aspergillus lucknowensis]|uniref:Lysine decarboxylase-like protein n=1 Tax=Aspergillus lucknowensis TaxID=176173 RepID=A0ABR4LEQ0_9EURO
MTNSEPKPPVVCVFCGSVEGADPVHMETARRLAHIFHENNIQLVYGGGTKGLMGEIARTLVKLSGPSAVHGVIPRALVRVEPGYNNSNNSSGQDEASGGGGGGGGGKEAERVVTGSDGGAQSSSEYGITTIVPDMHTRKRLMAQKVGEGGPGSGFVSLAGGFGTIEEVMEMTTWNQLGIHHVGVVLLNVGGYWDGLLAWVRNAVKQGYISEENGRILVEAKNVEEVWPKLVEYQISAGRMKLNWTDE